MFNFIFARGTLDPPIGAVARVHVTNATRVKLEHTFAMRTGRLVPLLPRSDDVLPWGQDLIVVVVALAITNEICSYGPSTMGQGPSHRPSAPPPPPRSLVRPQRKDDDRTTSTPTTDPPVKPDHEFLQHALVE